MKNAVSLKKGKGIIASFIDPFLEFRITGLDISDLSMKYMSLIRTKKNKIIVSNYGDIEYPEGIITNGEIKDEQKFIDILKQWRIKEGKKLLSPFVVISLPEEKSFIRAVQIPRVKPQDVANAIRWEIENQIPLPIGEVVYDYEIMDPSHDDRDHLDVIITAFPRDILQAYVRAIKGAGLQPYAIELESQSLARASLPLLHDINPVIILDIGRTHTSLVIFAGGAILYTSTIEVSGLIFENNIAKQMNVTMEEAKQIKIDIGLDKIQHGGEVFNALAPAITVIGDELVRAISYYHTHNSHVHDSNPIIKKIFLTGGDANLRGLDTYLAIVLKLPVERADPFSVIMDHFAYDIPPFTRKDALTFATAFGLALREIRRN